MKTRIEIYIWRFKVQRAYRKMAALSGNPGSRRYKIAKRQYHRLLLREPDCPIVDVKCQILSGKWD